MPVSPSARRHHRRNLQSRSRGVLRCAIQHARLTVLTTVHTSDTQSATPPSTATCASVTRRSRPVKPRCSRCAWRHTSAAHVIPRVDALSFGECAKQRIDHSAVLRTRPILLLYGQTVARGEIVAAASLRNVDRCCAVRINEWKSTSIPYQVSRRAFGREGVIPFSNRYTGSFGLRLGLWLWHAISRAAAFCFFSTAIRFAARPRRG